MQSPSGFAGACSESKRQRDKLGQVSLRLSHTHQVYALASKMSNAALLWHMHVRKRVEMWPFIQSIFEKAEAAAVEQPQQESQVHVFLITASRSALHS